MAWQKNALVTIAALPKMFEELKFILTSHCNQDALGKLIFHHFIQLILIGKILLFGNFHGFPKIKKKT